MKNVWYITQHKERTMAISTRFCNTATERLCANFDKMRVVADAMENVRVFDRSVDTDKAAAFVAELREYGANPANSNAAKVAELADDVEAAIPHIRYITKDELLAAHDAFVALLNKYAAERTDAVVQYCIMMPPFEEALKSNMWAGLRALRDCSGPAWGLAATFKCKQDMDALRAYSIMAQPAPGAGPPLELQCLFFDDVMYSGGQMAETMTEFDNESKRFDLQHLVAFACVPFVHVKSNINDMIHPALRDMVNTLSATLPIAANFIRYAKQRGSNTLTYTQTKVPDYVSFPSWLARLENPFSPSYTKWLYDYDKTKRGGAFPLFRNCGSPADSCMTGSYVPVLRNLKEADGAAKLVNFCTVDPYRMYLLQPHEKFFATQTCVNTGVTFSVLSDESSVVTSSKECIGVTLGPVSFLHGWEIFNIMLWGSYRVVLLSMADVTFHSLDLFNNTIGKALLVYETVDSSFAVSRTMLLQQTKPGAALSMQLLTFTKTPRDGLFGASDIHAHTDTHHVRELVLAMVRKMHAAGMAHGRIGAPSSYRFAMPSTAAVAAVHMHPASFTHVTFQSNVSGAAWDRACGADFSAVEDLIRALPGTGKTAASHRDKEDKEDDETDMRPPRKRIFTGM
jgi:hypothetical protein